MIEHLPPGSPLVAQAPAEAVVTLPGKDVVRRRLRHNVPAMFGLIVLGLLVVVALFAPLIATHDPLAVPEGQALSPSAEHWFGTDQNGRDLFSRVVYGARTSLRVGIGAALLATVVGTAIGTIAGFRRGWLDSVLMRITEVFLVVPALLLAGAFVVALGRDVSTLIIVLGIVGWPMVARVARGTVMEAKQARYVEAARVAGVAELQILWRHVLPHALPAIAVVGVLSVGTAILSEAALSFLSIGVTEPTPSWGLMISGGRRFLASAPHIVLFPAAAIFVTVLACVALSDGVRDAWDAEPRMRNNK